MRLPSLCWLGLHISTSQVMRAVKTYETGNKNKQITVYIVYLLYLGPLRL